MSRGPKLKIGLFDPYGDRLDLGKRWEKWIERFERDLKYNRVNPDLPTSSDTAQMALLIYAGPEVEDIHDSLPDPVKPETVSADNWTEYRKTKEKLNIHFLPQRSNDFALFELMRLKPEKEERTRNYAARLRKAAEKCNFQHWSADKMIKCLIISNMHDEQLRLSCLQKEMTLDALLEKAEKKEDATTMSKIMHGNPDEVKKVNPRKGRYQRRGGKENDKQGQGSQTGNCFKCGKARHKEKEECPATGKKCDFCKKPGHFAKVCFRKLVNNVTENPAKDKEADNNCDSDTDSDYELLAMVSDPIEYGQETARDKVFNVNKQQIMVQVKVDGVPLSWQPDTGATGDIFDERQFKQYEGMLGRKIKLEQSQAKLYAYGSNKSLEILGEFKATLRAGKNSIESNIIVTKEKSSYPLLSESSLEALGLITYNKEFVTRQPKRRYQLNQVTANMRPAIADIIQKHKGVFDQRIGKAKGKQVEIITDENVKPVIQKSRRIPYNLEDKAAAKIKYLLEQDIIEEVPKDEIPTWVSPTVIAPKPNSDQIRLCVDMRMANKAIIRPQSQLPTTDDVINKFHNATTFSKLDLREAYHQFELTPDSRKVTTFYRPDGLLRYKCLNLCMMSAQDIQQNRMKEILGGIPHQINLSDDVLIGKSQSEHNHALV